MAKPSEFYVGVLDFFAILLPGAIAIALIIPSIPGYMFGTRLCTATLDASSWAVFLICAYFVGHIIFLVGSSIDFFYDIIRRKLHPDGNESAFTCATHIRDLTIKETERSAVNTYQWCRSILITLSPAAAEDIHRLEADSKFFRSMIVVCSVGAVAYFVGKQPAVGFIGLALAVLCFFRYYERRLKTTTQAYIHVITLNRLGLLDPKKGQ